MNYRGERLGEEIKRIISDLLARELKDPAFGDGLISITYVKSTADGSFATVFFTSLGADNAAVLAGFESAKGFIRNELGRKLGIRRAPELRFKADEAERYGRHIDELLDGLDLPAGTETVGRDVSFSEIPRIIEAYERYLVFTHVHMDGDTLGAAVAFAEAMHEIGKEALVVVDDKPPRTLELINAPYVVCADEVCAEADGADGADADETDGIIADGADGIGADRGLIEQPYLAILMDFTDPGRLEGREALFEEAEETLSIDHHTTAKPNCDYNYIEPGAAATSEIVYRLLQHTGLPVTERIATALYVGIVTDTGRFQYTNTTPETHRISAGLLEAGADFEAAYRDIYQSVKAEKLYVQCAMLNTLEIFAGGKAALAFVRADTLAKLDAGEDETDGMSEVLRSIIGVEVSAFLKEMPDRKIKVSMRSKDWFNVAALAESFGGGGHLHAAGFTSELTLEEVCVKLKEVLTEALGSA